MKILVLDNFDSFTYNLVHYLEDITNNTPDVYRNDEITIDEIKEYNAIILSPGPGLPDEAGITKEVIKTYADKIPMLGVCLGLQAIVEVFGGELENLKHVFHGVATEMTQLKESIIFKGIPNKFEAARYHSWVASHINFPSELEVTAIDNYNQIMALQHVNLPIYAVQFHPESILTPCGKKILMNFINSVN